MKKATLITCFVFVLAGSIFTFFLVYPAERNCLNIDQVRAILDESKKLDGQGQLQRARQGYKQIDIYACGRSKEQNYAINRSMVIGNNIRQAYDFTMKLIAFYHQKNGEYPSGLDDIREFVPKDYIQVFNGFRLVTKNDGTVDIVTGLYGSVSFSLN